jgi:DNA gyrase subunit B|tara:strand:- start:1279 stop:3765 length:2487 start_codon:yes stop_codon:yes gene_type:complete
MSDSNKTNETNEYGADNLQHLSDREHVRKRPGMYIGDTFNRGLHHLVYEVVDNSIDEAMADHASLISVVINPDGSITVEDDGRGIPVEKHEALTEEFDREVSTLEGVMTVLKFGGKFDKGAYQTSGGLHGVGVTVVNFLSQWCKVEVGRDGYIHRQEYEYGNPVGLVKRGEKSNKTGTKTTFKPDGDIFETTKYQFDILAKRMQDLAFLNRGITIEITDERSDQKESYCYENGIIDFVHHLNRASDVLHEDVFYIEGNETIEEGNDIGYEIALQYTNDYTEHLHSYVNNIHTHEGGTHETGFRKALTRVLNAYGLKEKILKDNKEVPTGDDVREGMTVILSAKVGHPQFEGQTKTKLGNREVESVISSNFGKALEKYLEENPKNARIIIQKGIIAMEAREAAKKARQLMRKRKDVLGGGSLPGKLRDCISKDMEKCELYLVEGDSAGGSAEGGRLKQYQAILPLRGKIINAYKARVDKVLANEEVQAMINAIGCGFGDDQNLEKLRYNKIIIMTDADVDGSHIRTLLLCFFYRQMYSLMERGHVYVAQPPLFRVKQGKNIYYIQSEDEMKNLLLEKGLADAVFITENGDELEGEEMGALCRTLSGMEEALLALERRGINLKIHAQRQNVETGKLPMFHVFEGTDDFWFSERDAVDAFIDERTPDEPPPTESADEGTEEDAIEELSTNIHVVELHEVRTINAGLKDLQQYGLDVQSLLAVERTGVENPRYILKRGDTEIPLKELRGLLNAVRAAGEKGLQLTRFKGLGEMNAEELRDTTLDPNQRTLVRVTMDDVAAADEMFRVLMGDKVEPRREFIEKYALDVQNLDV